MGRDLARVTSPGLWAQRRDLATVSGCDIASPVPIPGSWPTAFLGWGDRPSGRKARRLAERHGARILLAEDGMLKGFDARLAEPPQSFVLDRTGIYFRTFEPNDLARLLDEGEADPEAIAWARAAMARLRAERVTKFNNWPDLTDAAALIPSDRFFLLIDQVPHDASIAGAGATIETFSDMLRAARDEADGRKLVVRAHPAGHGTSPLLLAAKALNIPVVAPGPVNPWRLIEAADAVYTISSQLGFEALFAGKRVAAFGRSFYAGRGLTDDRFEAEPQAPVGLETLFHALHARYSVYLDLHDRTPCDFDTALEQALGVRAQRTRLSKRVITGGLSPWKRKAIGPFLVGKGGRAHHALRFAAARHAAKAGDGQLAIWGATDPFDLPDPVLRIEDGFIRSVGLGVDLTLPGSLAIDRCTPHYDCARPSDLETLLATASFDPPLLARAQHLRETIVAARLTKYNVAGAFAVPEVEAGRLRLLVPGQVETDRSILFGSPVVRSNADLVARCRALFPDAYLVYKPHPDVVSGMRDGGKTPEGQDHTALSGSADRWIGWCDRLETMTSLAGFEALLRGKPVGVHGLPFYAGWGLTDDRMAASSSHPALSRRRRRLGLDELVAGALILYPFYLHPGSRLPCSVESFIDALQMPREDAGRWPARLGNDLQRAINRFAVRIRDRRRG